MQNSGFTVATTDCGVTPQAQNTGVSSAFICGGSPKSGFMMSLMPISSGMPICTGAPCTAGNRVVIWMARIASAGFSGRIDTTSGPWNGPAGGGRIDGAVHRHGRAVGDVAQLDAVLHQRVLERERAAEREDHEIVAPVLVDVGRLVDQFAVAEHLVAAEVGADVEVAAERRQAAVARARPPRAPGRASG
jgi:hypothetical protein